MYIRGDLHKYQLGSIKPPSNVKLPKGVELVWNDNIEKWQIYLVKKKVSKSLDELTWQIDVPFKGSDISPGIKYWLQKYDTTEGGKLDQQQLEKNWVETFKRVVIRDEERKEKQIEDRMYEVGHVCRFLERLAFGAPQCVVPAGPVVGINRRTGKTVRAYKKPKISKEIIVG